MREPPPDRGERAYRALLRLLLRSRAGSGTEDGIVDLFREARERARAGGRAGARFWTRMVVDAVVTAWLERFAPGREDEGVAPGSGIDARASRDTGGEGMDRFTSDLRYALRQLARRPGFAAILVVTLALGIGANTAVFSVVHAVLLDPLPYPEPDELVVAWTRFPAQDLMEFPASPPEYLDYRDQSRSFEALAAHVGAARTLTGEGEPERVQAEFATWQLFPILGVEPRLGRVFTREDDRPDAPAVTVLSDGLWQSRFGGDPSVVGRDLYVDGTPYTVIGVMPPGFAFPDGDTRLWLPLGLDEANPGGRGSHFLAMVGRLAPGTTLDAASRELDGLMERWYADPAARHVWNDAPDNASPHPAFLRSLEEEQVGDVTRPLWIVLGAVVVVLLIACANVANLLLVRGEARVREMSVRTAMGAVRWRLLRQLLTESVVTALVGGAVGLALAWVGVRGLRAVAPADLPRLDAVGVHGPVLLFTLAVTVAAGILFGLAPAFQAGRADVQAALREEGRGGTSGRGRLQLRQLLVVSQTALAVVLLVSAGLLLQSLRNLTAVDPGFDPDDVLRVSLNVPATGYPEASDVSAFYRDALERLGALPGVRAAGAVRTAPLAGSIPPNDIAVEDYVATPDGPPLSADVQMVTPGYFEAMGIPLLEGRAFEAGDDGQAPLVAVVSEALARTFWPGRSALTGGIRQSGRQEFARVVGVVGDVRQESLEREGRGTLYLVHAQGARTWYPVRAMTVVLRTGVAPTSLVDAARREVKALDPDVPLYQVGTMEGSLAESTATQRFVMLLQLVFAGIALVLAAVGIYGVMSFTVARRTSEIGIRMALGAERGDVLGMVVRQGMGVVAAALALGVVAALASGRVMASLLFGVSSRDPVTYAAVVGLLLAVALLACWVPARRASGVDPGSALRAE